MRSKYFAIKSSVFYKKKKVKTNKFKINIYICEECLLSTIE